MSVEDLGKEYEKHAEIQQHFIDKCKAEIKKELEETAIHLKNYYKKGDS